MSTTHQTPATRTLGGVELPAAGRWEIDPGHAEVAFIGRHLVVSKVRGHFTGVRGAVVVGEAPEASSLEVEIDMASVDSGDATRDEHLRSADLLDVEAHPTATYRSTAVRWDGASGTVEGELTIHGVTRPVGLQVEHLGTVTDPWGGVRAAFSAHATIDREDWGLTWNMPLETGGLLVSKEIRIEVEVETVRTAP